MGVAGCRRVRRARRFGPPPCMTHPMWCTRGFQHASPQTPHRLNQRLSQPSNAPTAHVYWVSCDSSPHNLAPPSTVAEAGVCSTGLPSSKTGRRHRRRGMPHNRVPVGVDGRGVNIGLFSFPLFSFSPLLLRRRCHRDGHPDAGHVARPGRASPGLEEIPSRHISAGWHDT